MGGAERPRRRTPAPLDPFDILRREGPVGRRNRLTALSLEQLCDVVGEYRVEPYTLAMKWKTPSRLVGLIVDTIDQRARKGEAFR